MVKYKIGHYYRKDYFHSDRITEYTIIKLTSLYLDGDLRGEIVATNMETRYRKVGEDFSLFQPKTESTRIYEVTFEDVVTSVL